MQQLVISTSPSNARKFMVRGLLTAAAIFVGGHFLFPGIAMAIPSRSGLERIGGGESEQGECWRFSSQIFPAPRLRS